MRKRRQTKLHLVRVPDPSSRRKRVLNDFDDRLGDSVLEGIYDRRVRCLKAVKQPLIVPIIPTLFIALLIASVVYVGTMEAWALIGAYLVSSTVLWFYSALALWQFVYRPRLARECWELRRFASEHRLTPKRFRQLWTLSTLDSSGEWPVDNDLPHSRLDRFAERVVAAHIPALGYHGDCIITDSDEPRAS